jgi:hypothetical protein
VRSFAAALSPVPSFAARWRSFQCLFFSHSFSVCSQLAAERLQELSVDPIEQLAISASSPSAKSPLVSSPWSPLRPRVFPTSNRGDPFPRSPVRSSLPAMACHRAVSCNSRQHLSLILSIDF